MARGWESKSVEEQQDAAAAAAAARAAAAAPAVSADEAARRQQLEALHLARARTMADLQRACRPAHRGMLEQALSDLDGRIRGLNRQ